jgi:glutathione peroxidase-family protein
MLLVRFDSGDGAPDAEPLLEQIASQSPYDYVRASAMLELARQRFLQLRLAEMYDGHQTSEDVQNAMIEAQMSEWARDYFRYQYAVEKRLREMFVKTDRDKYRHSALDLLDRIIQRYSGVVTPTRYWESASNPGFRPGDSGHRLKLFDANEPETWRRRTTTEWAEFLRFQQTRLQLGLMAPNIDGLDLNQQPIRLSQFRGQIVLLTTIVGSGTEEYKKVGDLLKSLEGQPFTCLSVISGDGDGGRSSRDIIKEGKVTWPIIRDTVDNDIGFRWQYDSFYLIDKNGVIRLHFHPSLQDPAVIREIILELINQATPQKTIPPKAAP